MIRKATVLASTRITIWLKTGVLVGFVSQNWLAQPLSTFPFEVGSDGWSGFSRPHPAGISVLGRHGNLRPPSYSAE